MRKIFLLPLMIVAGFYILPVSSGSQASTKAAPEAPSWYITDLGTKLVYPDQPNGYIYVKGMWYATNLVKEKQLIAPIAVKITCNKDRNNCQEIDATVAMGILQPDTTDYEISTWTREQIVAEDTDDGTCKITHRLVLNFQSKTVTVTDLPSQVDTKECKIYGDANSYILHGGQVMLYPWATYDPLKVNKSK